MFKPKGHHVRQSQVEKFTRYSIRKVSFGAASVAVATGLFFLGGGSVQAAEPVTNPESTEVQNPQNVNEKSPEPSKEVTGQASATAKELDGQNNTSVKESAADKQNSEVKNPNVVAEKVAINTASLEDLVAKAESRLSQLTEGKKTKSVIDDAKNLVNKAKELLNDDTKTQEKVDSLAKQLSSSLVILNSIKSEATEEKETKNQDPRNGQAIPGKGESGFRTVDTTAANAASEAEKYKGIRDAAIPQLQTNIERIKAEKAKEEAKPANKKDQAKIDILVSIINKAEGVVTTANAADVSSAQIMSQQAEAVKSERDLLALYLAGKADMGAPVSENHVAYGNNPTNGVFESLKEGFGDKVTFTDAVTKSETIAKQQRGQGEINARTAGIGSATYNWKEKSITKADAEAGVLNGWKIEVGEQVNAVQPLDVTNVTDKDGAPSTRTVPKSKIYTNNEELKRFYTEGQQLSYNNGSGIIPTITPTIDAMKSNAFGEVRSRDYYLELGSKGTTISKEYDVNGNSRINVNLIHGGAYGHVSTTGTGEHVKLKIVDAFTGAEIKPVDGKSGPLSTEQGPGGSNGWNYMARLYDIPATTTKIKVLIEAGDQAGSQNGGTENQTQWGNRVTLRDGYLIGGIGIATAPAAEVVTNVSSERRNNEYGYTPDTIYDKNQKGSFNFTLKDTAGMNIDYYAASQVQVTVKVPKGVVLEDRVINANGGSAFLGGVYANSIRWTPNDSNDNSKGGTLTYNVPASGRMAAAEKTTRSSSIVFTTANNFIGPADFKVTATSGFGDTDAEGNKLYSYTTNGLKPAYENQFNRNGLANSDNPTYEYGRVIFINSLQATGVVTVPINTNNDQLKEVAYAKAQEEVNSANFQHLLRDMNATAGMGQITNVTLNSKDKVEITKIAADGRGVVKVPVTYTADGRTYDTTVDIEVNVVKSTTDKLVVLEGDKITNDQVKSSVTPATIDNNLGTVNNPNEADVFSTVGKANEAGLKIPTTVTHVSNGTNINETVEVPVLVLPKATGEVEVHKGASVDKVKEVAKAKATEVATSADFKAKLPVGSKDVVLGEITEEVLATMTAEKGTNKGIVKVPVTYTVDGKSYTKEAEITVNVLGSEPKTVYTVEGTKPDAEKVKNAVTPGTGGTANAPKETDLPATTVKAGTPDVTVPTTVTYPTGDETVNVPVEVLPKATPEKVTTLKDTTGENLTTAVKAKAQAALGKLTLPSGVTVELVPNQNYAVPATDSNGDKDNVPVKVQYKDATGTVVAEDTISVPVTVVSSTPSKIVVFEGDEVTADTVKGAVTPGTNGTKGTPVIPTDLTKQSGEKEVTLPVAYDGITEPEQVKVPVTVLPKATGEADVPKGSTVDKVKEVAKAKATELVEAADFKGKLPTGATVTVGDITEAVAETLTNEKGTNKGVVNVPATYTVDGKTYNTTIPVTINVLGSEPKTVYTVEGTKPDAEKVKNAVTPGDGGTVNAPKETDLPATTVKAGTPDVTVPTTVTYPTGDETVNVPVEVLPKATPEKVTTLKDTTGENLTTAVKAKAQAALGKLTLPSGVTVELVPNQNYAVPATDSNGDKDNVPVKVQYKDATGTVVAEDTINVPVTVVSSTPAKIVVFEGETPTAEQAKTAVTPGTDGTKGEPTTLPETTGKAGATDITVDVPVTYDNGKLTETVKVPVTVLPKPEADEILVPKNGDKEKAKEKVLAQAEKAIADGTFTGKLPQGARVEIDKTAPVTVPDLTDDTEVDVTVKYTVDGQEKTTTVKVPVTVVEGVPQIVPVDENNKQPDPEKSIDKTDYPEGATFRYKTPEGQTTPIDVTTPGDKDVIVEVLDKNGNPIAEVPATVRVVESYPKYVPVDPTKKQPDPKENINPNDFPTGTTFEYKDNTPVDTTTPGEKPVTVVAKLNGQPITEIPAKIVVVEPKTQYVPVNAENDKKPKPQDSITPDDYPEGSIFEYKTPEGQTTPYDGTTPGEKDVTVVVKDPDGDTIVEVPAKIKVVQGKEQLTPVNAEDKDKPKAEDSITPSDYPEGSTFEYKVPEGQTTPYDGTTPGDKPVTVVVKDKDGKVLVEVPATIKVVETKPTPIETPVTNTPLTEGDYTKGMKIPEGATVKVGDLPDLTTPGEKTPVKVTITLPNGKSYTVDVPVTVTPVKEIETPVTTTPLTPEDYTKGITIPEGGKVTNVANIPDLTTPGKKDPVKVTIELPNGKVITVDVPVNVTPVKEIETPVTTTPLTPEDYTKGITIPEGGKVTNVANIPDLTTPGKKDPVKVTIELPNGKVITVDVPVTVTPVKEIETPVTTTPLTPEDYTKGITIPEGGKVTKVENIPDLTTPGKKDPVKVTIELPNGKVITVDVPVTVTPITPIETPVTITPLTPEDYTKGIKIPEGGKVTNVENIPDLTTPGKKDPVKVTITLPNGKVVTVEVPVNVTPIKDIVKKQGDPITAEDVENHIPKGAKVISIGDKPTTDVPGERPSIPVVIELPNGIRVTMDIPVIVTPKVTPVVVKVGTPVTPEDVQKHIELPNGWKVTKVGEIPTTSTPGTKPVVPVEIELPDGRKITVDVPVIVTPTVRQIVVPQGTPITPDDVKGHIDLPKEPGWEIVEVGEIPTTIPAGVKPSVKVKVKVPTGEIVEVEVPIIVTPKVTPIVVEVGTPITKEDVIKKVGLPEGWEIVEVGKIPTTETPGAKPVVKVKVKLPDGRIITVEVPVTVTPKSQNGGGVISQNGDSTVQVVTEYLDENGNRITSDKEGKHNPIELEGYEFSHSTTDAKGNTLHHYKKVKNPINQEQPSSPETPTSPEKPVATPVQTSSTDSKQVAETTVSNDKKELPNTGTEDKAGLASLGLLGMLGAFGLVARKKKED